jgi:flagellin
MVERLNNATGALGALRYLQSATKDLDGAQSRLSSGLKVTRARDDATSYHSAAIMRGQGSSLNAVALSLGRAESISDTAIAAAEQISKQLIAMKSTATQAMSEGLTADQRRAFQNQYDDQMQTLQMFIRSASFDDANILDGSKTPGGVSFIADAEATQSVTLEGRNFMPGGPVIVAPPATNGLANTQAAADTQAMLDQSIANLGDQMIEMSAERKRIEAQKGFVGRLADALAAGVGRMVDTDLAAESALIQALQVKQELSAQSIGIANSAPQALLSLFRPT